MALAPNPTNITPPRVPLIDERTGAISREWYRWLLSLFDQVETNSVSIIGTEVGPDPSGDISALQLALDASVGAYGTLLGGTDLAPLYNLLQALGVQPSPLPPSPAWQDLQPRADNLAPVWRRLQDLSLVPAQPVLSNGASVAPVAITPGASPYTYQNASSYAASVVVQGGTVTKVEFSRDGTTFFDIGVLAGMIALSAYDSLRVTYAVAPTMTLILR